MGVSVAYSLAGLFVRQKNYIRTTTTSNPALCHLVVTMMVKWGLNLMGRT